MSSGGLDLCLDIDVVTNLSAAQNLVHERNKLEFGNSSGLK
jgi:hypothetical protein